MNFSKFLSRAATGTILPLLLLGAWHYAASRPGTLVPTVSDVCRIILQPAAKPESIDTPCLGFSALVSLTRVGLGYLLAVTLAVPLGLLIGRNAAARAAVSPLVTMLRVVCPIAWLPLAILLLGVGNLAETIWGIPAAYRHKLLFEIQPAMVFIICWGAFFPILLATASSAHAVRKSLLENAWLLGAGSWSLFRHVVLPHSLPSIVSGMRIGLGISWMVIVAAELYPGTRSGLGYTIWVSQDTVQYQYTFAAVFYIMAIGLIINGLLWFLEKRLGHWQAEVV
jgi:NitT/TauT family transport system permease protein